MATSLSYPGVYIEEVPSGVRTITGVATSITAFIGRALRGAVDEPVDIFSFADFEREFGGLSRTSSLGYAVRGYFQNGGGQAVVVRVHNAAARAVIKVGGLPLTAASEGAWGNALRASVDIDVSPDTAARLGVPYDRLFNLTVRDSAPGGRTEVHRNVSLVDSPRQLARVLASESRLVRLLGDHVAAPRVAALAALDVAKDPAKDARTKFDANDIAASKAALTAVTTAANNSAAPLTAISVTVPELTALTAAITTAAQAVDAFVADNANAGKKTAAQAALTAVNTAFATARAAVNTAAYKPKPADDDVAIKEALLVVARASNVTASITAAQAALTAVQATLGGDDGQDITDAQLLPANGEANKKGLHALLKADVFNLLVIPPLAPPGAPAPGDLGPATLTAATAFCEARRALFLIDAPDAWNTVADAKGGVADLGTSKNAAVYFPRLLQPDPLRENQLVEVAPTGVVAGVIARTDSQRGLWKAPAGLDASLVGVPDLAVSMTDGENGLLNPLGVNCLRTMPAAGRVVWGARTLQGNDRLASEWKYIPVRRLALFIEESLYRGTQWVVFEPNDEPLWGQIRLNVGAFMQGLFRQGAFQGQSPKQAYFVKCDRETTTQTDINLGVVNVHVGFAPLKPAEFVVLRIQQIAGAIAT